MKNSESTGLAQSQGLTRIFYGMGGVTVGSVDLGMLFWFTNSRVLGLSRGLLVQRSR